MEQELSVVGRQTRRVRLVYETRSEPEGVWLEVISIVLVDGQPYMSLWHKFVDACIIWEKERTKEHQNSMPRE